MPEELSHNEQEDIQSEQPAVITPEQAERDFADNGHLKGYLLKESGDIDESRLEILRKRFKDAIYASIEDPVASNRKLSEVCDVCFNAIEISKDPEKTGRIFKELGSFAIGSCPLCSFLSGDVKKKYFTRVIRSFPKIKTCVEDGKTEGLGYVADVLKEGDNNQKKYSAKFITENLSAIKNSLQSSPKNEIDEYHLKILGKTEGDSENSLRVASIAEAIFINGTDKQKESFCETMESALLDPKTALNAADVIGTLFHHRMFNTEEGAKDLDASVIKELKEKQEKNKKIGKEILDEVFYRLNITQSTSEEFIECWTKGVKSGRTFVSENLSCLLKIERDRPGITEGLFQRFGIVDFGRYPEKMLVEQYDNRDNDSIPYGVVLFPRNDWNGVFHEDPIIFSELFDGLNNPNGNPEFKRHLIRVFECGSKKDVAQALIGCDQVYGSHKISFAIIGGHGGKNIIQLGSGKSRSSVLLSKDLRNRRVRTTADFFEPGAPIVFASCSTGKYGGIGQTLSKEFGMKVTAPNEPTKIKSISPVFKNGKIDFDVEFSKEEEKAVYVPES